MAGGMEMPEMCYSSRIIRMMSVATPHGRRRYNQIYSVSTIISIFITTTRSKKRLDRGILGGGGGGGTKRTCPHKMNFE